MVLEQNFNTQAKDQTHDPTYDHRSRRPPRSNGGGSPSRGQNGKTYAPPKINHGGGSHGSEHVPMVIGNLQARRKNDETVMPVSIIIEVMSVGVVPIKDV